MATTEAYKTTLTNIADLKAYVGKELGLSGWTTITQEDINTFAEVTGDHQWIHVDVERCKKESPFKQPIAHGFLVLSLASKISYEALTVENVSMGVNYGLDKVRFTSPTPVNSKVRGRVSLMDYEERDGGARYKVQITFELEGSDRPACVAEFIALAFP
ncbi:MAG: MaoC family dehydratase [Bacteroidota bacterium]